MSQLPKNQQHNSLLTLTIGIMVAVGRAYLSDNTPDDLTTIMSIVNIVAFGFVITLMLNDIYNAVNIRISDSGKSTKSKQKLKFLLEVFFLCTFTLFSIIGINYIINHRNTTSNDIISIIALSFSIANDGFVQLVENPLYKLICASERCGKNNGRHNK